MDYKEYLTKKKPYQELGYLSMLEKKHYCLFYKPGKGKTYPTIDAIRDIDKNKNGNANILILSTKDAIEKMWKSDIVPQNILPKNTTMLSFTAAIQELTKIKLLKIKWDCIVIDECHKIKAHNTKISKLVYTLTKKTEYVFGLSGTPRGNTDIDIYCEFHNMNISEWGTISYTQFVNCCCDIDKKFFRGQQVVIPIGINNKYKAGWEKNIAMYSQRVDYDEDDNMIDPIINIVKIPYNPTKEYFEAEEGIINIPDYETTLAKLAATLKVWQIANGFMYLTDKDGIRTTVEISRNNKLDWLNKNLTDKRVIVYNFEADAEHIMKELDKMNYTYTEDIDTFKKNNANILLLQCSRCESFNLQHHCDRITFFTYDYSFIKFDQMLHRVWRMGQEKQVQIDVLINENTIEEKIWKSVQLKQKFADLFMSIKGE